MSHDGTKPGSDWYLEQLYIDVDSRGERYVFECQRWLEAQEDGAVACVMVPTRIEKLGETSQSRHLTHLKPLSFFFLQVKSMS